MVLRLNSDGRIYEFFSGPGDRVSANGHSTAIPLRFGTISQAQRFVNSLRDTPGVTARLLGLVDSGFGASAQSRLARLAWLLATERVRVTSRPYENVTGAFLLKTQADGAAPPAAPAAASFPVEPASETGQTEKTWIEFRVVEDAGGTPVGGLRLEAKGPDGKIVSVTTDPDGRARLENIEAGPFALAGSKVPASLAATWALVGEGEAPVNAGTIAAGPDAPLFPPVTSTPAGLAEIVAHRVTPSDSLASLARSVDISWQDLTRFNWGTSEPDRINEALRLKVGSHTPTADGRNLSFSDTDHPGLVFLPRGFRKEGLATETVHTFRVIRPPAQIYLESRFALDQLAGLTKVHTRNGFRSWVLSIFGTDIPIEAADALRADLRDGRVSPAYIDLLPPGELGGEPGRYDKKKRRIEIDRDLAAGAVDDPEAAGKLLFVLVHEFGHHVDELLRNVYSSVGSDAAFEEGAAFAHVVALLKPDRQPEIRFARYFDGDTHHDLAMDHGDFPKFADRYASEDLVYWETESEFHAHFGSGEGHGKPGMSFAHQSIEREAFAGLPDDLRFTDEEVKQIYFGNWLRDFSQVIDPKIIEQPGEGITLGFSREAMTEVVNVLAELHFIDPQKHLTDQSRSIYRVTPDILGVYLPVEHVDNPYGVTDGKADDPDFRGACTAEEVRIDPERNMGRYIASNGSWDTTARYITDQLNAALAAGPTPKGRRHFGNALHPLEDYFSHSNFCELALRKVGYDKVHPWAPASPGSSPPVVTGNFGGLDTLASILYAIGETLAESDPFEPGARTEGQRITLILMRDKYERLAEMYEGFLKLKEEFQQEYPLIWRFLYYTVGAVSRWMNFVIGNLILAVASDLDDMQSDDPGTNPSHTQLAKDHEDHPFHGLAARLAIEAARLTGEAMARAWKGLPATGGDETTVERVAYKVKTGDSIAGLAQSIGITWQELARYNWGTDVPSRINIHLRDDVGCTKKTASGLNYVFTSDDSPGIVYLPKKRTRAASDVVSIAIGFLVHPDHTGWMDDIVKEWALANPGLVAAGETPGASTHEWDAIKKAAEEWQQGYQESSRLTFER